MLVRMERAKIMISETEDRQLIWLKEPDGARNFPIVIGIAEAFAIDRRLKGIRTPRPLTHDLLATVIETLGGQLEKILVNDLRQGTFFARLIVRQNGELKEIDARPSDAIILALKSKIPILVATKILNEQGIALTQKSLHGERFGIRIQELTPALASHFNFKDRKGVLVAEVVPSSVSEAAGIKAGDIITKVNSKEVGSVQEFEVIFDRLGSDNSVQILLFRDNKSQEVNLFLK